MPKITDTARTNALMRTDFSFHHGPFFSSAAICSLSTWLRTKCRSDWRSAMAVAVDSVATLVTGGGVLVTGSWLAGGGLVSSDMAGIIYQPAERLKVSVQWII